MKAAIAEAVGPVITVSCAIAPSAYLAKTAAEANKPDAAVVWRIDDIPAVYEALELDDLPGLGPATEARLRARGIDSVTGLYHAGRLTAAWAWGSVVGTHVHGALHGHDDAVARRPRVRLSHGRVLEPRLRTWARARPIVRFLVTCAVHRCRREGVAPKRLLLEVVTEHGQRWSAEAPVAPTNHERAALRAVTALWDAVGAKAKAGPLRLTVSATELVPWPTAQVELFEREGTELQGLLDKVRGRFGAKAITLGDSADRAGHYTGVKIAFEHIPAIAEFEWLGIRSAAGGAARRRVDRTNTAARRGEPRMSFGPRRRQGRSTRSGCRQGGAHAGPDTGPRHEAPPCPSPTAIALGPCATRRGCRARPPRSARPRSRAPRRRAASFA